MSALKGLDKVTIRSALPDWSRNEKGLTIHEISKKTGIRTENIAIWLRNKLPRGVERIQCGDDPPRYRKTEK